MGDEIDLDYKQTKTLQELLAEGVLTSAGDKQLALDEKALLGESTEAAETVLPAPTSTT